MRAAGVALGLLLAAPAFASPPLAEEPAGAPAASPAADAGAPLVLSVDDAVEATLAAQPRLRAAEAEVRAASARATQAAWQEVGTLDTTGLYTPWQRPLQIDFSGIPNVVPPVSFEVKQVQTYSLGATLTQPLWTWGALSANRRSAQKDLAARSQDLGRQRQQMVLEASQAFFTAAAAAAAVSVAEQALAQQQAFARATRSRMEAGSAARLDVLKAELTVKEAESALLTAHHRERLAREALVSLSLDQRFREARLRAAGDTFGELPAEADAVARALRERPDLEALRRQGEGLDLRVRAIGASSLPSLSLYASLTQQNDELARVFRKSGQVYQASLALRWDATAPLRNRPRTAELRALRDVVSEGIRAGEEGVALEVRSALLEAAEAREQVRVAESALATAEEQARVARLAYQEGVLSALEARDAELGLTSARFSLLRARLDRAFSQARLRFAIGD